MPTDAERAAFELGIKFGALYHQFAGTPVSPDSSDSLETAIEESIGNQPYASAVRVGIDDERLETAIDGHGYTELTGEYMEVTIVVEYDGIEAVATMEMVDGYPLMGLQSVESA